MQTKMKKICLAIVTTTFFVVTFFSTTQTTYAGNASLFFSAPTTPIGIGDEFAVTLMLNSGGQTVNTIAGDMLFSDPMLELIRVTTGNSVVTSWIQSPIISGNSVTFSGIMPGGYESTIEPLTNTKLNGSVLTLVFRALNSGSATISFSDSHLYLNDGLGTETPLSALPYTFTINKDPSGMRSDLNDTVPPEEFTPIVSASTDLFEGAYAIFFSTTDKGSGIDHYEVKEGGSDWVRADSPYKLSDQSLKSTIRVKAVDVAGNVRIAELSAALSFSKILILIPIGFIVILLIVIFVVYERKMKKLHEHRNNLSI